MHWQFHSFSGYSNGYTLFAAMLKQEARKVTGQQVETLTDFAWDHPRATVAEAWNAAARAMGYTLKNGEFIRG